MDPGLRRWDRLHMLSRQSTLPLITLASKLVRCTVTVLQRRRKSSQHRLASPSQFGIIIFPKAQSRLLGTPLPPASPSNSWHFLFLTRSYEHRSNALPAALPAALSSLCPHLASSGVLVVMASTACTVSCSSSQMACAARAVRADARACKEVRGAARRKRARMRARKCKWIVGGGRLCAEERGCACKHRGAAFECIAVDPVTVTPLQLQLSIHNSNALAACHTGDSGGQECVALPRTRTRHPGTLTL